jgi:hypothetical protein
LPKRLAPATFDSLVDGNYFSDARSDQQGLGFALAVSTDLMRSPRRVDTPIRDNSFRTYLAITREGRGYCADFVKAFTAIALARGLAVRQWGFAFDGFGSGHTFNEIYDPQLQKWVLVDSFHSLYFVDPGTREPLSTLEVHDRLLGIGAQHGAVEIVKIIEKRFPFRSDALAMDYYRRGMPQLWLVWGGSPFDYEASIAGRLEQGVHRALGQLVGIATGKYPKIRIYPVGLSQRDYRALVEARNEFFLAALFSSLFALAAVWVGWRLSRNVGVRLDADASSRPDFSD